MSLAATLVTRPVRIKRGDVAMAADLTIPEGARAIVLFAHGSGSSRHSQRNRAVAHALANAGLASLLADLLTEDEARIDAVTAELRFDIGLLAGRVVQLIEWAAEFEHIATLPIGLFGASTGAAAALVAAAERPHLVRAVVSRGGRPDLADGALDIVTAPTLLIVGSRDTVVIELNRQAMARMDCERKLQIVPGATHLFEEPGALEVVARLAIEWYVNHST
jgi:pimeloyl-ACP methyl ester carboxylesterase